VTSRNKPVLFLVALLGILKRLRYAVRARTLGEKAAVGCASVEAYKLEGGEQEKQRAMQQQSCYHTHSLMVSCNRLVTKSTYGAMRICQGGQRKVRSGQQAQGCRVSRSCSCSPGGKQAHPCGQRYDGVTTAQQMSPGASAPGPFCWLEGIRSCAMSGRRQTVAL
jgi:hypothetical protein